jgi:hypothetical protein
MERSKQRVMTVFSKMQRFAGEQDSHILAEIASDVADFLKASSEEIARSSDKAARKAWLA